MTLHYIFIATHFNQEIMKETKCYIQLTYLNTTDLIQNLISI
jgi:hypothetical protein